MGDLAGNAETIVDWTRRAAGRGAHLVVFPEMMLTGYPVEDLALRASFVDASIAALHDTAARLAAEGLGGLAVVTGYLGRETGLAPRAGPARQRGAERRGPAVRRPGGGHLGQAPPAQLRGVRRVPVLRAGEHAAGLPPPLRPGDGGTGPQADGGFRGVAPPGQQQPAGAVDVAIAVCEDLWQDGGPVAVTRQAGAGLLVVPNASPYERGKDSARLELCVNRAAEAGATLAYVNMMGGQDELVFDGDSIIVTAGGELLARGPQFAEALVVADLDLPAADPAVPPGDAPADACDGTQMTIRRVVLPPPPARPATAPPDQQGQGPVTEERAGGVRGVAPGQQGQAVTRTGLEPAGPRGSSPQTSTSGRGWTRWPRSTPRWSPACGTTWSRTGSAR